MIYAHNFCNHIAVMVVNREVNNISKRASLVSFLHFSFPLVLQFNLSSSFLPSFESLNLSNLSSLLFSLFSTPRRAPPALCSQFTLMLNDFALQRLLFNLARLMVLPHLSSVCRCYLERYEKQP